MYCYNYILISHCLTSGEKFYIIISNFFCVWIFPGFWTHLFPTSFHHTSCKKSTSEHINSLFIFSPQQCKNVSMIYAWFCFPCSHTYIFEIWLLRNQLLKCKPYKNRKYLYAISYKFRVQNQNVIVLRRANTRMYFLPERAWFGSYLKMK